MKVKGSEGENGFFINYSELVSDTHGEKIGRLRRDTLSILEHAVKSVDPYKLITANVKLEGKILKLSGTKKKEGIEIKLDKIGKNRIVAFGKASLAMARAIATIVDIDEGIVVIPHGQGGERPPDMDIIEAEHPVPAQGSLTAANRVLEMAEKSTENDLLFALISGGGSSLLAKPVDGITLEEKIEVTNQLLKSGCTISEMNTVRKHISAIKGGKLAEAASPATTFGLILSDVLGDPVDFIASGPTAQDTTTFKQAQEVLEKYALWTRIPENMKSVIERGMEKEGETKKPSINAQNFIIGSNYIASRAALGKAETLGYNSLLLTTHLEGESKEVAKVFTALMNDIRSHDTPLSPPAAVIAGGETTVTVTGNGHGGRNQEFVLSAAMTMPANDDRVVIASMGTDGIDGMSDAAGAIADGFTLKRASKAELNPDTYLRNNDSNTFFVKLNDALITGRTGTNVNDVVVMLVMDGM